MTIDVTQMDDEANATEGTDPMTNEAEWRGYAGKFYTLEGSPAGGENERSITGGLWSSNVAYE